MNGEKTLKIVMVASSPETETFHWAMQDITREYGKIIDLHFYHLSAVDEELDKLRKAYLEIEGHIEDTL